MYFHSPAWRGALSGALPLFSCAAGGPDQKLGIGRQHFAHDILKFASGGDLPLHLVHPIPGDALDMSATLHHEGECPSLVTLLASAMAAGIPAARVTASEGPGQQIGRDGATGAGVETCVGGGVRLEGPVVLLLSYCSNNATS